MAVASDPTLVFTINGLIRPTDPQDLETGMEKLGRGGRLWLQGKQGW